MAEVLMEFPQLTMSMPDGREESIMKRTCLVRHTDRAASGCRHISAMHACDSTAVVHTRNRRFCVCIAAVHHVHAVCNCFQVLDVMSTPDVIPDQHLHALSVHGVACTPTPHPAPPFTNSHTCCVPPPPICLPPPCPPICLPPPLPPPPPHTHPGCQHLQHACGCS
jgi:hypothetical protein